ncbi:MAG: hypothetical protein FJ272_21365 [Planctomycetes bacterium]|nr:hypothetical protein [Planctomycetota bacterium]
MVLPALVGSGVLEAPNPFPPQTAETHQHLPVGIETPRPLLGGCRQTNRYGPEVVLLDARHLRTNGIQ